MDERYHRGAPKGKANDEYYQIVAQIEDKIRDRWPHNYASISPYISSLEADRTFCYGLLLGDVQGGKFLTANILMWILAVKHHLHVAYMTKNLGLVRDDAMMKIEHGYITALIKDHCTSLGLTVSQTNSFLLSSKAGLGLACDAGERVVPVFIMQPDNYKSLFNYVKAVNRNTRSHCVIIVDEVHELYTEGGWSNADTTLLPIEKGKKITGRHAMHMLYDMCKRNNCATLLGITATPERVLIKDPLCLVDQMYDLVADPPFEGAVYYGIDRTTAGLVNVKVEVREDSYIDTVDRILERPANTLHNGSTEVKFIYISSEHLAVDQDRLYNQLVEEYGDRIYCKLLIGDETAKNNEIDSEHVVGSLPEFFDSRCLTPKICMEGAIVLIADKMLAASATVKPFGRPCEHHVQVQAQAHDDDSGLGDRLYSVVGITDQIISQASNIESHMQKMRLHGWYPSGHESRCWAPRDYVNDTEYGVNKTHIDILQQYDIEVGPASLTEITPSTSVLKHICPDCPYTTSKRFGIKMDVVTERPEEGVELETRIHSPDYSALWDGLTLGQFKYESDTRTTHGAALTALLKPRGGLAHQMPWPQKDKIDARYREIIDATVQPRLDGQWKVNSFSMSDGDLFDDPISSLYTVVFKSSYADRPHWPTDECQGMCSEHLHVSLQTPIWFKTATGYMTFKMCQVMEHKYASRYIDWVSTPAYEAILSQINRMIEQIKAKAINAYHLFGSLCKANIGESKGRGVHHWTWVAAHYKAIGDVLKLAAQKIAQDADLDEDEKTQALNELLAPYFAGINDPPPAEPAPVAVRVKGRVRPAIVEVPIRRVKARLRVVPV